jgi:hypothetical protein
MIIHFSFIGAKVAKNCDTAKIFVIKLPVWCAMIVLSVELYCKTKDKEQKTWQSEQFSSPPKFLRPFGSKRQSRARRGRGGLKKRMFSGIIAVGMVTKENPHSQAGCGDYL